MPEPKVFVLVLSCNGKHLLDEVLSSYLDNTYTNFKVILVDNGSTDQTDEFVKERFPSVEIIRTQKNLGYSGGMNLGLSFAFDKNDVEYALISNNDARADKEAIRELVKIAETDKKIGFVTGKVYFYDQPGRLQTVGKKEDPIKWNGEHIGYNEGDCGQYDQICERCFVDDIFMLVSRSLYRDIGGYNILFQFQAEEFDWQARAKEKEYKIMYTPHAKIWHKVSATIGKNSAFKAYYDARNPMLVVLLHKPSDFFRRYFWHHLTGVLRTSLGALKYLRLYTAFKNIQGLFSGIRWGFKNKKLTLKHFIAFEMQKLYDFVSITFLGFLLYLIYKAKLRSSFLIDDAFITFRYAKNLISGNGFVYNKGEIVYGTSSPLFGMLLAFIGYLSKIEIHRIAPILNIILFLASAYLLYKYFYKKIKERKACYLTTALFITLFLSSQGNGLCLYAGMESYLCIFLLLLFLGAHNRPLKGLILFLIFYIRFDVGIVLTASILVSRLFNFIFTWGKENFIKECKNLLFLLLIPFIVLATNYLIFGSPIPNTILAKKQIYINTVYEQTLQCRLNSLFRTNFISPLAFILWLSLGCILYVKIKKKEIPTLPELFVISYALLLGIFIRRHAVWYFPVISFFLLFSVSDFIARRFKIVNIYFKKSWKTKDIVIAAVCLLFFISFYQAAKFYTLGIMRYKRNQETDLYKIARTISKDSKVFCGDIGVIGYFSGAYIYDYAGLVTPPAIDYNKEKIFYPNIGFDISYNNLLKQINKVNPDYIILRKQYSFTPYLIERLRSFYKISLEGNEFVIRKEK